MQASPDGGLTQFLDAFHNGDPESGARLVELTYRELSRSAVGHILRARPAHSLQATDPVNEAYLLHVNQAAPVRVRANFLQVAAHVMRQILIDRALKRRSARRGGGAESINMAEAHCGDQLALGGLTEERIAEALGISARTINREWQVARAWLYKEIQR